MSNKQKMLLPPNRQGHALFFRATVFFLSCMLISTATHADTKLEKLLKLSLDELSQLEVTTLNNRPQSSHELPAAIYIISREDIKASGATTVPDLLIRIPGVFVREPAKNSISLSVRNDNQLLNANTLVLIDSKAQYLPQTNNIAWRFLPIVLEDIQRIEVIRGNGGTAWGTNSSAGVINIITRQSDANAVANVRLGAGNQDYKRIYLTTNQGPIRLSGHATSNDDFPDSPSTYKSKSFSAHYHQQLQDWKITAIGNAFKAKTNDIETLIGTTLEQDDTRSFDYLLQAERQLGEDHLKIKAYHIDYKSDFSLIGSSNIHQETTVYEARYLNILSDTQRLQFSTDYRDYTSKYPPGVLAQFSPNKLNESLFNFAVDYERDISKGTRINGGIRYEDFSLTNDQLFSASLRLSHQLTGRSLLWTSINHSHQFPSFTATNVDVVTGTSGTTVFRQMGNKDLKAEQYNDIQLGVRHVFTNLTQADISLHYVKVKDEIFVDPATASSQVVGPLTFVTTQFANHIKSTSWGAEMLIKHRVSESYNAELGLTYFKKNARHQDNKPRPEINNQYAPEWKATLLNNIRLSAKTSLYLFLNWETSHNNESVSIYTPSSKTGERFRVDGNIQHLFTKRLRMDAGFKNLFNDNVDWEYIFVSANPTETEPSFFVHLTYTL